MGCGCGCDVPAPLKRPSRLGGFSAPGLAIAAQHASFHAGPRLTAVLDAYVQRKLAAGEPFAITPELSSRALGVRGLAGLGFFAEIAAALASAAGTVASVVGPAAEVAAAVHTIEGPGSSSGGGSQVTADQIASAILPNVRAQLAQQGVTLPSEVAHQAVAASILDSFGAQYRPLVIAGLVVLGGAVVLKLLRR